MADIDMKNMGQKIKDLRLEQNLSQVQLACMLGIAQNTVAQYEKGTAKPSIDVLINLAINLKTSADYLLGLEELK